MNIVVVESPAKAKTINKYLGRGYEVLASFGHVRDLPAKDGSVDPKADFRMIWEVDGKAQKRLGDIAKAVKGADKLILATDPDREGEAISWHVLEVLKERRVLKGVDVERVVFNAITKQAVTEAMKHPRAIDTALVDAYLARRALDYLVGFTLSPVLWRKLPGSRSAGRVQSVALRLVCDRELEIEKFVAREYWSLVAKLATPRGEAFEARLVGADGQKIQRLDIGSGKEAEDFKQALQKAAFKVALVESKPSKRNPYPPFTTSTLQQEASRKLGYAPAHTMRLAQRLYEGIEIDGEAVGLITYMRTDGVDLAEEAIAAIRQVVGAEYGARYVPDAPRRYQTKQKNAQEAHEAIRPTDVSRHPREVAKYVDSEQAKLYELIWIRALASQMESAELERTAVDITAKVGSRVLDLRANGTVVKFDGFLKLYQEGRDDETEDDESRRLPEMSEGEALEKREIDASQHFTEPPPRYSEASLVKRMEELGIGRPSTYASILQVLKDRKYVRIDKRRLVPEDRGRIVVSFLENFFARYVDFDFTANLEEQLDRVSNNEIEWRDLLRDFWRDFTAAVGEIKDLSITQVIDVLNDMLAAGCRSSSASSAPSSAARIIRNAAIRARSRHRPRAPWSRSRSSARTRRAGSRSRCARAASGLMSSSARRSRMARNPSAPGCPRAPSPRRSISSWRSSCCRCRARSGCIRRTASPSKPASAASVPMCCTARPTPMSRISTRSSPSASTAPSR
jgi:DNA topoisomerase-1